MFFAFVLRVGVFWSKLYSTQLSKIRMVYDMRLVEEGSGNVPIDFVFTGALYKMVRNMVGTCWVFVGGGWRRSIRWQCCVRQVVVRVGGILLCDKIIIKNLQDRRV